MKKIKHTNWLVILIFISLFIFSCSKDNDLELTNISTQENFVELSLVKEIANNIPFTSKKESLKKSERNTSFETKTVESIHESKNKKGKTSFYIINYTEGGFVILSADKRTQPILGVSENTKFIIDENSYPPGLKFWLNDAKKQITDIQNSNIEQSERERIAWEKVQTKSIIKTSNFAAKEPPIECYEHTETYTKGPLLSSNWHQTGTFNNSLPFITCNGANFQVLAGCVPIAMGQVMRYYEYPSNYDWASMPLTSWGTSITTANFIADIHAGIDLMYSGQPMYNCDATGVSASANMGNVLKSQFNYSSASWSGYDRHVVESNIANFNRPVILSGDNGTTGHMWVCDGYRRTVYLFDDCTGVHYLKFHMNWGWGGTYNGWYSFDNFNPGNTNYNNNKKMIYNIIP